MLANILNYILDDKTIVASRALSGTNRKGTVLMAMRT
jgi:hypothetical protein